MALNKKYIYFDIESDNLNVNKAVGYEVQFSADERFKEIRSRLATFENPTEKIYYSIDDGANWVKYPYEKVFNTPYKIRVEANTIDTGYVIIESNRILYKIRSDIYGVISSESINEEVLCLDINNKNRDCYLLTENSILVTNYDNSNNLKKKKISLLHDAVLSIDIDSGRNSFWQINSNSIYLRNFYGEILKTIDIPTMG